MRMDGWYWRNLLQQIWPFSARVAAKRWPVRSNEETVFSDAFQVFQVHLKETMSVLCSHLFAKILRAWGLSIEESSAGWLYPGYGNFAHLFVRITMMIVITDDIVTSKNYTAYDNDYSRKCWPNWQNENDHFPFLLRWLPSIHPYTLWPLFIGPR